MLNCFVCLKIFCLFGLLRFHMGLCRNTLFAACSASRTITSSLLLSLLKVCPFVNLWTHPMCLFMIIFRMQVDWRKLPLAHSQVNVCIYLHLKSIRQNLKWFLICLTLIYLNEHVLNCFDVNLVYTYRWTFICTWNTVHSMWNRKSNQIIPS